MTFAASTLRVASKPQHQPGSGANVRGMYPEFLTSLFEQGRACVGRLAPIDADQIAAANQVLCRYEAIDRMQAPGEAPAFILPAASWAAQQFYRACQLAVFRQHNDEDVRRELDHPFAGAHDAAAHYSVDLVFRYLPDLFRLASINAEHDPLLEILRGWAREWPLSSVGLVDRAASGADRTLDVAVILEDPCLRILYADRVVLTGDASRLADPRVAEQVRAALGIHPALAAAIHPSLRKQLAIEKHLETGAA